MDLRFRNGHDLPVVGWCVRLISYTLRFEGHLYPRVKVCTGGLVTLNSMFVSRPRNLIRSDMSGFFHVFLERTRNLVHSDL